MEIKIYIVGCAKTGTTLLRRMFHAFDGLKICDYEISLLDFIKSDYNVAKRTYNTLFSNCLSETEQENQSLLIVQNNINVINVSRDKDQVLSSSNGYVTPERYSCCEKQFSDWYDIISMNINYKDLIKTPDFIQYMFIMQYGFKIKDKFSNYPQFVPNDGLNQGSYKLRPLGEEYEI